MRACRAATSAVAGVLFVFSSVFLGCTGGGAEEPPEPLQGVVLERQGPGLVDGSNITEYAASCRAELGRLTDATFNCRDGTLLHTTNTPDGADCDKPVWLDLGGKYCVDNARLLKLKTSNPNTEARVICRRYKAGLDTSESFQDVAIVVANKTSGATCYFQALSGSGPDLNGKDVPNPMADPASADAAERTAATAAKAFYISPQRLRDNSSLHCSKCHDSDPWMHSPYIDQVAASVDGLPTGFKKGKYKLVEEAYLTNGGSGWPKPETVTTAKVKDGAGDVRNQECTACHRIGTKNTCSDWLPKSVDKKPIPGRNAANGVWPKSHWMPEVLPATKAEFHTLYDNHIKAIQCCCSTPWKLGCSAFTDLTDLTKKRQGTGAAGFMPGAQKCVDGTTGVVALGVSIAPIVVAARGSGESSCTSPFTAPLCASFSIERTDVEGNTTTLTEGPNGDPLMACASHSQSPYPGPHESSLNVEPGDLVTLSTPQRYAYADNHDLLEFVGWQVSESCPCADGGSTTCQFRTRGSRHWFGTDAELPEVMYEGDPESFHCQALYQRTGICQTPDAGVDAGTDAGVDAGYDGGLSDAGFDGGVRDAGFDGGVRDAGNDAGIADAGVTRCDSGVSIPAPFGVGGPVPTEDCEASEEHEPSEPEEP